ncbi:DUF2577 domain-containing protein [Filifactor villosus]|uniref:DUF2577 domain-containing protein n=1 Tax=Filifactor villosus TaxID=29374 RepID=A0ABV9QND4_9FIRM
MDKLLHVIKKINHKQISATELADFVLGTVVSVSPLRVQVSDRITLDEDMLLFSELVLEKKVNLKHKHNDSHEALETVITIQEGIKQGDTLQLIKLSAGQLFLIISKVRDKKSVEISKEDRWQWS